jgi:threonine dehydratase
MVSLADVEAARQRIAAYAHRTPVMTSTLLDERARRAVFFKCECFQRVGAFKFRGAMNALLQVSGDVGVITHSSGNHAQALALAAKLRGARATVVMPDDSPKVKVAAVRAYGAEVVFSASTQEAREAKCAEIMAQTGATFISPYDDDRIIAGAGTAALELVDEVPDLDVVVAPVGGGGLLSGTGVSVTGRIRDARVYGAEPAVGDDAAQSMKLGRVVPSKSPKTLADGLRTGLSERTLAHLREHVTGIITVTEDEILAATWWILTRMKIVVEPSAAAAFAAVCSDQFPSDARRVGVVLSGGNIDWPKLGPLLAAFQPT